MRDHSEGPPTEEPELLTTEEAMAAAGAAARGGLLGRPVAAVQHTFRSLRHRDFRFLWFSTLLQTAGQNMNMIALGYFVYELTGSAARLGGVVAAMGVPGLLVSLYGGALGDRLEKKTIIQVSQVFLALTGLFIAVSIRTDTITWQHLLGASFVYGTFMSFL